MISASYTGDTCDQVDAATGMIYGGANFKFVKGEYTGSGSETGGETGEKPSGGNDDITQTGVGAPVAAAMPVSYTHLACRVRGGAMRPPSIR